MSEDNKEQEAATTEEVVNIHPHTAFLKAPVSDDTLRSFFETLRSWYDVGRTNTGSREDRDKFERMGVSLARAATKIFDEEKISLRDALKLKSNGGQIDKEETDDVLIRQDDRDDPFGTEVMVLSEDVIVPTEQEFED